MSKSSLILLRIRELFNCFYQPCQTDALNNNFSNYCFMSTQLKRKCLKNADNLFCQHSMADKTTLRFKTFCITSFFLFVILSTCLSLKFFYILTIQNKFVNRFRRLCKSVVFKCKSVWKDCYISEGRTSIHILTECMSAQLR